MLQNHTSRSYLEICVWILCAAVVRIVSFVYSPFPNFYVFTSFINFYIFLVSHYMLNPHFFFFFLHSNLSWFCIANKELRCSIQLQKSWRNLKWSSQNIRIIKIKNTKYSKFFLNLYLNLKLVEYSVCLNSS